MSDLPVYRPDVTGPDTLENIGDVSRYVEDGARAKGLGTHQVNESLLSGYALVLGCVEGIKKGIPQEYAEEYFFGEDHDIVVTFVITEDTFEMTFEKIALEDDTTTKE